MSHVILLGDSIFDNARYVPGRPPVIDQLRRELPHGWRATLLAVDGHVTEDVIHQLQKLPDDATHLIVSVGGNDALGESNALGTAACTVGDALGLLHEVHARFRNGYRTMLRALSTPGKPAAVCTIYDRVPGLGPAEQVALAGFNAVILREAIAAGLPVVDLRLICDKTEDYSHVSPIQPSALGGAKIAHVIADVVTKHDFAGCRSVIYA